MNFGGRLLVLLTLRDGYTTGSIVQAMIELPMQFFPSVILPGNVFQSFSDSSITGKIIVLVLMGMSVWCWTAMASKWKELALAQRANRKFLKAFQASSEPLLIFLNRKKISGSPVYEMYREGCRAMFPEETDEDELFVGGLQSRKPRLTETEIEAVEGVVDRTMADQMLVVESNMGGLATATSTAPFLGLLGTVWGVMEAFTGMAEAGAPTLSAVAPGISSSLLTTVVGLLVALPSAIGYNFLTNKVRAINVQLHNFSSEMGDAVKKHYAVD